MEAPQAKGGADALVQKIPRQHAVQFTGGEATLFQRPAQDPLRQILPVPHVFFPKEGVRGIARRNIGEWALPLHAAADVGEGHHAGRMGSCNRLAARSFGLHRLHLVFRI